MKALILTAALPLLICIARAQDTPPVKDAHAETVKKAHAAAWLGIAMAENYGKVVVGQIVPGSPAEKAGLQAGDRILRIGDTAVEGNMRLVIEKVRQSKPGDTIELRWKRGDKEETTRIELAERPAQLEEEFRGEFRREKNETVPPARGKIMDRDGNPVERGKVSEGRGKTLEETKRIIEDVKQEMREDLKQAKDRIRLKVAPHGEFSPMEHLHLKTEEGKKKLEGEIELDPFKDRPAPGLSLESPKADPKKGEHFGEKLSRHYFDKEWPGDKAGGVRGDKDFTPLLRFSVPNPAREAAIWGRVQDSIARALKESDIGPDVTEKVLRAVKEARRSGSEKDARRAKLEAEAAKAEAEAARLSREMQALKERSEMLREELKKAKE